MMRSSLAVLLVAAWGCFVSSQVAYADECTTATISTSGGYGGMNANGEQVTKCGSDVDSGVDQTSSIPGTYQSKPVCLGGATTCDADGKRTCEDGTPMLYIWFVPEDGPPGAMSINCPTESTPGPGPSLADIASAFRQVPLPRSTLQIQPPGGETLVNFTTNFLTEAEPFERTVSLLAHRVDFKIRPTSFRWAYGDGAAATTSQPGARYPTMGVTHVYRQRGTAQAAVDTTWSADYRVDGGRWAAVPDTVTIRGATQTIRIRTATPLLAGAESK